MNQQDLNRILTGVICNIDLLRKQKSSDLGRAIELSAKLVTPTTLRDRQEWDRIRDELNGLILTDISGLEAAEVFQFLSHETGA